MFSISFERQTEIIFKISVTALGTISLALGVWQLYQPTFALSPSAAWAFVTFGTLATISTIASTLLQRCCCTKKNERGEKNEHIWDSAFPVQETLPEEIWLHIFSFLDPISIENINLTCNYFYKVNDQLLTSEKMAFDKLREQYTDYCISNHDTGSFTLTSPLPNGPILTYNIIENEIIISNKNSPEQYAKFVFSNINAIFSKFNVLDDDKAFAFDISYNRLCAFRKIDTNWSMSCYDLPGIATKEISNIWFFNSGFFAAKSNFSFAAFEFQTNSLQLIGTFKGHKGKISKIILQSGRLFSGSEDGSIKEWDNQGDCVTSIKHSAAVWDIDYFNNMLVSITKESTLVMWTYQKGGWHKARLLKFGYIGKGIVFRGSFFVINESYKKDSKVLIKPHIWSRKKLQMASSQ